MKLTRRAFLQVAGATGATLTLAKNAMAFRLLKPAVVVDNPLDTYPDRRWESVYRDQYQYDRTFTYCCSPNDTHACRIRAFVRNNVMMRVEQNYDHQNYSDLYGNKATRNWNPRMCLKGYTFHRRVYGPYRLRYPLIRKGWKRWADDGFPELTPENKTKYMFDNRGNDELLRASWDEAFTYASKGIIHITKKYSGPEGAQKLIDQGYPKEMVDRMQGAGTRTFKGRGGMGLLGVIGKYGMYRFNNCLAIVDAH
ncbi:MAG: molybdopterin-dependent oxidoreductase, partial [Candidatus Kuenenia stuttgartiensis]|nr:molybdopterin-dependent oxidoreductase [Candidatus Kuenenia stuttgartiensis]